MTRGIAARLLGVLGLIAALASGGAPRLTGATAAAAAATPAGPAWQDTGLVLPGVAGALDQPVCFDTVHPDVFFRAEAGSGTVAYNWRTGTRQVLNARMYNVCGPRGLLFAADGSGVWRFSLDDPTGRQIDYLPSAVAADGSLQVYAFSTQTAPQSAPKLWSSADGGLTWTPRLAGYPQGLAQITVAAADSRVVYAVTAGPSPDPNRFGQALLRSTDAGATWQTPSLITDTIHGGMAAPIGALPGRRAPVGLLAETQILGGGPRYEAVTKLSWDGGVSFTPIGAQQWTEQTVRGFWAAHTGEGVIRLATTRNNGFVPPLTATLQSTLELRPNGQTAWQPLPLPFPGTISGPAASVGYVNLVVDDEAPANLFLSRDTTLYHSLDGGHTWEQLPAFSGNPLQVTPYLPLTVLDVHADGHIYALAVPDAAQQLRAPVAPSGAPGAQFFPVTGHNLAGPVLAFWQSHGGLAQIGYPLTEPIRQVSPVDGRIYAMQYFERAVLEWHPENAPPYDILGSLIGAFSYQARYGLAGAPGQHASTDHPRFFPETVHTVGGAFRTYWETHGGLAQQGYPISEEFTEVSALDGQPYTVQYFQRAVFEWHPENAGTPYAVLLSQLGRGQLDGDIPPLPVCARGPGAPFSTFWGANPTASARLGCPAGPPPDTATAVEPFEHGRLVWLAAGPFPGQPGPTVLVLTDDGRYQYVADTYVNGRPDACSASPPAGRYVPQHGFNQVWCTTPGVRAALGWALAPESGGPGRTQAFATGWMLQVPGAGVLALGAPAAGTPRGAVLHTWVAPGP